jgi:POT family proton-dependent oligopeptide transporter
LTRHPKGVFLVSFTEMWERFSYYGISALLVLYLTAPVARGGFGWSAEEAIRLYGLYAGLAFALPAVGGWISSTFWGERRCIAVGAAAIMAGHLLLGGPAYLPDLFGSLSGLPVEQVLRELGQAHGRLSIDPALQRELESLLIAATGSRAGLNVLTAAYRASGLSFFGGLALVIAGTGLIKPTISSVVGKLYAGDDRRRVFGFTLFMVGIWSGSFLANFVAGTLGERLGWHYGFMSAAVGMGAGLAVYVVLSRTWLGNVGVDRDHAGPPAGWLRTIRRLTAGERRRLGVIGILSLFTMLYGIAFYQKAGMLHLLVRDGVDRTIGGFEIPASWFLSVSTGSFLVLAPSIGLLLARLDRVPDTATCLVLGLGSIGIGYVVLLTGITFGAAHPGLLSMSWIVCAYVFFGLGDVFIWPPQLAAVTALAPASMVSFVVGVWYVTVGAGTYGAGLVGAWAQSADPGFACALLLAMLALATLSAFALRPWLRRNSALTSDAAARARDMEAVPEHA